MATYKEIKGVTVQTRDEDPVGAGGSWSSGGNINNLRYGTGQAGTSTAGSIFFGYVPAGNSVTVHEYYDGTSFTEQTDGNTARESILVVEHKLHLLLLVEMLEVEIDKLSLKLGTDPHGQR